MKTTEQIELERKAVLRFVDWLVDFYAFRYYAKLLPPPQEFSSMMVQEVQNKY